ncbi:hypothetical protein VTL71DRAFT_162 [Oculimacula yallundae]
MPKSF